MPISEGSPAKSALSMDVCLLCARSASHQFTYIMCDDDDHILRWCSMCVFVCDAAVHFVSASANELFRDYLGMRRWRLAIAREHIQICGS